ncbi:MAG TPA: septal ring lytic transglycosylase RlpA family protein, partial [Trichormus sp.]
MIVRPRGRWLAGSVCFLLPLVALPSIDHQFTTVASWYGPGFQGRKTASGEVFDQEKMTAASRTLPFGTKLLVQNPHNGKVCAVVINDRGP